MSDDAPSVTPRADVLAQEYRGTYLWEEIDRLNAEVARLREALVEIAKVASDGHFETFSDMGEIVADFARAALDGEQP